MRVGKHKELFGGLDGMYGHVQRGNQSSNHVGGKNGSVGIVMGIFELYI